jgi:signal transduction histidine kinase
VYVFLNDSHDISTKLKLIIFSPIVPVLILLPTVFNMSGFDIENCSGNVGPLLYFVYFFEIISILWIVGLWLLKFYKERKNNNLNKLIEIKNSLYLIIGSSLFLLIFSFSNILGEITQVYEINLFGPIGMIIFLAFLTYTIVRFNAFNIKLFATQVLIWGLAILIGSQFFFIKILTNFILNGVTFIGIIIFGQILIRSVKREVEQRERLEVLRLRLEQSNLSLEVANEKLKGVDKLKTEFVSLASHQLRSPLTAIKGYTSMLLEGDYGEINPKVKETIGRVLDSSNNLTLVVEDLLDVAKIEQGGMKYDITKFNFGELVKDTAKDLSITAEKKGLKLICKISYLKKYFINGDKEKIRQVLINLIDNSMKYTPKGKIELGMSTKKGKVVLSIKDTGSGVSKENVDTIFEKFSRGDGAKLNPSGSGIGLYLVKEIMNAHKGRVWVESDGVGKGSTFFVEIAEAE